MGNEGGWRKKFKADSEFDSPEEFMVLLDLKKGGEESMFGDGAVGGRVLPVMLFFIFSLSIQHFNP